jgi:hypothetical protein
MAGVTKDVRRHHFLEPSLRGARLAYSVIPELRF